MAKKWTEDEVNILKKFYPVTPAWKLSEILKRSPDSINRHAERLKIEAIPIFHRTKCLTNPYTHLATTELAYIAGIFDGEGHAHSCPGKFGSLVIGVIITNTNTTLAEWLKNKLPGATAFQSRNKPEGSKPFWRIIFSTIESYYLLSVIAPYLVIKKEKVSQILETFERYLERIPWSPIALTGVHQICRSEKSLV